MLQWFRHTIIRKILSYSVLAVFLNLSVDPPDVLYNLDHDIHWEEDLSMNEIESVSEFVLEKCLDMTNAVPETEENDNLLVDKKLEIHTNWNDFFVESKLCVVNLYNHSSYLKVSAYFLITLDVIPRPPDFLA